MRTVQGFRWIAMLLLGANPPGGMYDAFAGSIPAAILAAGSNHSCAITHGALQCWGDNTDGQLGTGSSQSSLILAPVVGLHRGVTAVAAGAHHTCAVVDAGLKCWGSNEYFQLGNGGNVSSSVPVTVFGPNSGVTTVTAGAMHTCAVANGGLYCWGNGDYGQLGTGQQGSSPTPVAIFGPGSGVTIVVAGQLHTCAVMNAGLQCWGNNGVGQLGTGTTDPSLAPVPVPGFSSGVTAVTAGVAHTCAVVDGTQVSCWGGNGTGQLGNGTTSSLPNPTPLPISAIDGNVTAIAGGGHAGDGVSHTCAVVDGGIRCWGYNAYGQRGDGTTEDSSSPVTVSALSSGVVAIATGGTHTCATTASGQTYCWGSDLSGQIGDGGATAIVSLPTRSSALDGLADIALGASHGCGLLGGNAYCWGHNGDGQLGRGTTTDSALPQEVDFSVISGGVQAVGAGASHSCAILAGSVYCWGSNQDGQLGNGTHDSVWTPAQIGLAGAATIAGGGFHTCTVLSDSGVRCWGRGSSGQLGDNTANDSDIPVAVRVFQGGFVVPLTGATAVAAGSLHTCAVVDAGAARCWGHNGSGQLGTGSYQQSWIAAPVNGLSSGVTAIAAGDEHSCALVLQGVVKCWGTNGSGQLGDGTNDTSPIPTTVRVDAQTILMNVTAVAAGSDHSCAVVDGGVMCWGANTFGQLGTGASGNSSYAVAALPAGSGVTAVHAGAQFTCATSAGLATWCWGNGYNGRLGNGSMGYSPIPVLTDRLFGDGFED